MINIRHAHDDEASLLAEIGIRAWGRAMLSVGNIEAMEKGAESAFTNFTRGSWRTITVVERHGVPVGWAAREMLDENITDFWIDPSQEGQGLGKALLEVVEEEIRSRGFDKACLQTHARNEQAVRFFTARGYSVQWLSFVYSPKLDRDVETVGLVKYFAVEEPDTYGPGF
ncbi:MAG: GNAT family N-acetyltransferase [Rhizobium sp. 63-7]|nr:MAG: GNAT family N-acetyltransferase [Rhizobium sp. 63-7]